MLVLTLVVLLFQVRSISAMIMVLLTAPLGLIGTVPILLIFHQPFGFNAILGLLGLSGILMRNTLILIGQIHTNQAAGRGRSHCPARPASAAGRARRSAGIHPAYPIGFLGPISLHADWGHRRRHGAHPGVPARSPVDLVQGDDADDRDLSGGNGDQHSNDRLTHKGIQDRLSREHS